ncbi:hypothetical protein BDA96_03G269400 [Sorghum bicolor]|uniref:Uncharacterized protein n=2 Tax=Sorghum bicolor TaxID=4558 RepID=A0A921REJ3_SORBI|nr:hypothetical protein BDA96_03G269400 [Sorghum bicolor]
MTSCTTSFVHKSQMILGGTCTKRESRGLFQIEPRRERFPSLYNPRSSRPRSPQRASPAALLSSPLPSKNLLHPRRRLLPLPTTSPRVAMATVAVDRHQLDGIIAPAETAAAGGGAPVQKRRGWIKRMMYSPVAAAVGAEKGRTAAAAAAAAYDDDSGATRTTKPRRGGWLRRLMVPPPREHRRQRKLVGGGGGGSASSSRLLAGLPRWKRVSIGGGWASALLDAAAFRVMYVVEAVVLGLALSCFFCCCGCQI